MKYLRRHQLKNNKIILFDIDGTLMRGGNPLHHRAFIVAIEKVFNITPRDVEMQFAGMLDRHIIVKMLKNKGIDMDLRDPLVDKTCREMADFFLANPEDMSGFLCPGAMDLLKKLQEQSIPAGLVTGNVEEIAWEKMRLSGLLPYLKRFGGFGCSLVDHRSELIPQALRRAESLLGRKFQEKDAVIVGDTPLDVQAARTGGVQSIAVCGTFTRASLKECGADLVLDSLEQADEFINFIMK
jgi:phosphoglycolate phosphatase